MMSLREDIFVLHIILSTRDLDIAKGGLSQGKSLPAS